jgi:hypothetical protein
MDVDVVVQNCIFKKVIQHLRWYSVGIKITNAKNDCRKQQPQLIKTNTGFVVTRGTDAWKIF